MTEIILTQYSGKFIGPVAKLLGYVMNWIYIFLDSIFNIRNIGLCIILFTLIIYLCLLPLTIRQQKFSKLTQKMQPEIDAIRKKYKDKKDQASMMAMNEETQLLYQKYGISQTGTCIQMLIQMPILLALYRVIYNIPAYVTRVKDEFTPVINGIMETSGYQDTMTNFLDKIELKLVNLNFSGTETDAANSIIDVLYKMPTTAWDVLKESFSGLSGAINQLEASLGRMNFFLGINISNSPSELVKTGWTNGQYLLVFGALLVPVLSAVTQFLNVKLMPTAPSSAQNSNDAMANSMKTMNYMMPLMSLFFVFSLPIGMGIYWIAGSVIRSIQQVVINRYVEKIDLDEIIKKNQEKARIKREKKGIPENQISSAARINTRKLSEKAVVTQNISGVKTSREEKIREAATYSKNAKPGSLAAKANMVKEFNERNSK